MFYNSCRIIASRYFDSILVLRLQLYPPFYLEMRNENYPYNYTVVHILAKHR